MEDSVTNNVLIEGVFANSYFLLLQGCTLICPRRMGRRTHWNDPTDESSFHPSQLDPRTL